MAKKNNRKKRIPPQTRSDKKSVRIPPLETLSRPAWRFSTVDLHGPFAWPCNEEDEREIVDGLRKFDGRNWPEIEGPHSHAIPTSSLSKGAIKRLEEIKQDDVDEVFSFRLTGRKRVICIRDRGIAKLLWWDPDHQVCPSPKKHT